MIDCYLNIGSRITTNKLNYCPNPLKCLPKMSIEMPECVVLKQNYQHTQTSNYLHIATPVFSQFDLRVNCLFWIACVCRKTFEKLINCFFSTRLRRFFAARFWNDRSNMHDEEFPQFPPGNFEQFVVTPSPTLKVSQFGIFIECFWIMVITFCFIAFWS